MKTVLNSPFTKEKLKSLRAGDRVLLSGTIYTARDQAHKRIAAAINEGSNLPFDLEEAAIYYVGPSPAPEGRCIGSAGLLVLVALDDDEPVRDGLAVLVSYLDDDGIVFVDVPAIGQDDGDGASLADGHLGVVDGSVVLAVDHLDGDGEGIGVGVLAAHGDTALIAGPAILTGECNLALVIVDATLESIKSVTAVIRDLHGDGRGIRSRYAIFTFRNLSLADNMPLILSIFAIGTGGKVHLWHDCQPLIRGAKGCLYVPWLLYDHGSSVIPCITNRTNIICIPYVNVLLRCLVFCL